jgi:hypothetical protein
LSAFKKLLNWLQSTDDPPNLHCETAIEIEQTGATVGDAVGKEVGWVVGLEVG